MALVVMTVIDSVQFKMDTTSTPDMSWAVEIVSAI